MALKRPEPHAIVVFGASGDLTGRKVMPALYNLFAQNLMPERFAVIGYARSPMEEADFRSAMHDAVKQHSRSGIDAKTWRDFASRLHYVSGEYSDEGGIDELLPILKSSETEIGIADQRLFYCATPPSTFPDIAGGLGSLDLTKNSRIIVEKPFGHDLESARELNRVLHEHFDESQIFRIDHYLGKETVQNIMVFRFSNGMFEPIWNRRYVSSVQIDVAEELGIEARGAFYEEAGAVRDIVQNHLMQLLAILTMEPPVSFDAESIRDEKVKLLKAVPPIDPACVIRGQYTAGEIGGKKVVAYRKEKDVSPKSSTETFVAAKLFVENWRWSNVPFYFRTGKRLPKRATTITVIFHDAPKALFADSGIGRPEPNHLTIRIQPNEGITLTFDAKVPGPEMRVAPVDMHFDYDESFMTEPAEAYERLLHDCMHGDATLFTRSDEIERSWEIVGPILPHTSPEPYHAGTWGPTSADAMVAPDGWNLR